MLYFNHAIMNKIFILRNEVNAQSLYAFLKANWRQMADNGRFLAVSITEYKSKRSMEQNARYWKAVIQPIAEQAWINGRQFDGEAWHEHMKRKFIGVIDLPNGETIGQSSTALSVHDFAEFMTNVEAYATQELGVDFSAA